VLLPRPLARSELPRTRSRRCLTAVPTTRRNAAADSGAGCRGWVHGGVRHLDRLMRFERGSGQHSGVKFSVYWRGPLPRVDTPYLTGLLRG
jgi:hypothetical protein